MVNLIKAVQILSRKGELTEEKLKKKLGDTSSLLFEYGLITNQTIHDKRNKPKVVYHLRWIN